MTTHDSLEPQFLGRVELKTPIAFKMMRKTALKEMFMEETCQKSNYRISLKNQVECEKVSQRWIWKYHVPP